MSTNATHMTTDYATEKLVTDQVAYEIVRRTAKSVTLRPMQDGPEIRTENRGGNPWPVVYRQAIPYPASANVRERVLRIRKDGTFRFPGGRPLRFTNDPVCVTDYRY